MRVNKILFICPLPPPYGGQSIMSDITKNIIKPDYVININSKNKILSNSVVFFKIFFYLVFKKISLVYFTCSRSKLGALRDIFLLFLAQIKKVQVINHLHGNEIEDILHPYWFKLLILRAYKAINTTIFVSQKQSDSFPIQIPLMKKVVIPNCFDESFDTISWIDKCIKNQNVSILFISFLMESKGIFIALDVFERIAYKYDNVKFNIAGAFRSDYLRSAEEVQHIFERKWSKLIKNFPDRFNFHGVVTGDKKKDLFLNNDILLFPTFFKTESFGLVIVEAMRAGNVVVATDFNNISDIISEDNGRLVLPGDVESAFIAIDYFLNNYDEMKNKQEFNMKISADKYSQSKYESNIIKIFSEYTN